MGTLIHLLCNYSLITRASMGLKGTAMATFIANFFSLCYNVWAVRKESKLSEANKVSFQSATRDTSISSLWIYLKLGIPNIFCMLCIHVCFQGSTLMTGALGVVPQATNIIILNITIVCFQIPYGIQSAACALVG